MKFEYNKEEFDWKKYLPEKNFGFKIDSWKDKIGKDDLFKLPKIEPVLPNPTFKIPYIDKTEYDFLKIFPLSEFKTKTIDSFKNNFSFPISEPIPLTKPISYIRPISSSNKLSKAKANPVVPFAQEAPSFANSDLIRILRNQKENISQRSNIALGTKKSIEVERIQKLLELQQKYKNEPVAINFDTRAKLNIEETILDCYKDSQEFFIAHKNSIYTLGYPTKETKGHILAYRSTNFSLEESESLLRLDGFFIEKNQENIEKYKKQILNELEQKNQQARETIKQLRGSFSEGFSMQRYIVKTIFPMHTKKKSENYIDAESAKSLLKWKDTGGAGSQEISLLGTKPLLIEYLEQKNGRKYEGVAGFFGKTYLIPSKLSIDIDSLNNYYGLEDFNDFAKGFKDFARRTLEDRIKRGFSQRMQIVESNEMTVKRVQEINDGSDNVTHNEDGDIGFDKLEKNTFVLYRKIPKYIIKKNGKHYLFDSAKIGVALHFNGDSIKIDTPGFIYGNKAYTHRYALRPCDLGTFICHHNVDFNKIYGIRGDYQAIEKLKENKFAAQALNTIKVIENVLTYGCAVNKEEDMPSQCRIDSAEVARLKKQGIKEYDNDYVSVRAI